MGRAARERAGLGPCIRQDVAHDGLSGLGDTTLIAHEGWKKYHPICYRNPANKWGDGLFNRIKRYKTMLPL